MSLRAGPELGQWLRRSSVLAVCGNVAPPAMLAFHGLAGRPPTCSMPHHHHVCCAVAWTVYGITVTQLGDLTDVVMSLDAGGTVRR